jgi:hypothetical protein
MSGQLNLPIRADLPLPDPNAVARLRQAAVRRNPWGQAGGALLFPSRRPGAVRSAQGTDALHPRSAPGCAILTKEIFQGGDDWCCAPPEILVIRPIHPVLLRDQQRPDLPRRAPRSIRIEGICLPSAGSR